MYGISKADCSVKTEHQESASCFKKKKRGVRKTAKKGRKRKRSYTKKRKYTRRRGTKRGVKRHTKGISGRIGAFVLGVGPPLVAGVGAAAHANQLHKQGIGMLSVVHVSLLTFFNNLSYGFLGSKPFDEYMTATKVDGSIIQTKAVANIPKGSLLSVAGTGLLLMIFDAVASKISGGRETKIPFTNYTAIGSG